MSLLIFQSSKTIDMIQFCCWLSSRIIPKSPTCNFPIFHPNYQNPAQKKHVCVVFCPFKLLSPQNATLCKRPGPGGTRYQPLPVVLDTAGSICEVALNSQIFHGANPKKEQSNCISFHESAHFSVQRLLV